MLLRGLLPDTDYYYSFGNERDGFSDERRFRSKPSSAGAVHAWARVPPGGELLTELLTVSTSEKLQRRNEL